MANWVFDNTYSNLAQKQVATNTIYLNWKFVKGIVSDAASAGTNG